MKRIIFVHKEFHGNFIIHKSTFRYHYFIGLSGVGFEYYSLFRFNKKEKSVCVFRMSQWRLLPYTLNDKYNIEIYPSPRLFKRFW